MPHIHLFMNNPTAGSTDGTEISSGDETLPLAFTLNAANSETQAAKCAVRCDTGYSIQGGATVYAIGTNSDKWQFAPDDNFSDTETALSFGLWQSQITLDNVADTNVTFWVKATSTTTENPQSDRTVDIEARGITVAKEAES